MRAVESDGDWELVHGSLPGADFEGTPRQRADGSWIYRTVKARELWQQVMQSTYDHAEPGVMFLDRANADNNLSYAERIESTNPCGEQFLPSYGCCCLGSINLTLFVRDSFRPAARFDFEGFGKVARTAVRMLDNVLDATVWPLAEQDAEARAKRRIGLGFTGLGDALIMLGLRYDTEDARRKAARIAESMRDEAYAASMELAREKGAFPLFDAERYLAAPRFASRLPEALKHDIRRHGIRNSHLLSIAPTGTISLAFADNASNGIEPAYSWTYQRKKRMPDGSMKTYDVEDHAWRLFRHRGGDTGKAPAALRHRARHLRDGSHAHGRGSGAVRGFRDQQDGQRARGLSLRRLQGPVPRGMARRAERHHDLSPEPGAGIGAVDFVTGIPGAGRAAERPRLERRPAHTARSDAAARAFEPALAGPAKAAGGQPVMDLHGGGAVVPVRDFRRPRRVGRPASVRSLGERRRAAARAGRGGQDAVHGHARAGPRLAQGQARHARAHRGDDAFDCPMPPDGSVQRVPSMVAAFARIVRYRVDQLGALAKSGRASPVLDALFARKEPKTGTDGTLSWTLDVHNPRRATISC
jgi:ribonucleoside-diphosphate reductase alpha chain